MARLSKSDFMVWYYSFNCAQSYYFATGFPWRFKTGIANNDNDIRYLCTSNHLWLTVQVTIYGLTIIIGATLIIIKWV